MSDEYKKLPKKAPEPLNVQQVLYIRFTNS